MLDIYNQFRDFHIFKRFKYLLRDWWGIDILVVVKNNKRFFYDNIQQLNNPIVQSLLKSSLFKNHFLGSLNIATSRKTNPRQGAKLLPWKQTGLNLFVVPLLLRNAPLEAFLVATGFAPQKGERLFQSLLYLGLSKTAIKQKINNLKKLSSTDEVYVQKMLKILAEEFFILLQEKTRQARLIEKLNHTNARPRYGLMLGQSPSMQYIFSLLKKLKNDWPSGLLIMGANGVGKSLLAKIIHAQSPRAKKPFHLQNFSTFNGKLLEMEFFGYNPKIFPKKKQKRRKRPVPLVEKINGGALFLNGIENTSLEFQEKLLHFLKKGMFFVEGDTKPKKSNVKIIIGTSSHLSTLVKEGRFNKGLYLHLSALTIKVPPLKQRKEDIPLLIQHFMKMKNPLKKTQFSSKAMTSFYNYSWPGNVRELKSEIEKIMSLIPKDQMIVTDRDLSPHIRNFSYSLNQALQLGQQKNLKDALRSVEKRILLESLRKNNWNKSQVAKQLGASRTSVVLKSKEYGLDKKEGA